MRFAPGLSLAVLCLAGCAAKPPSPPSSSPAPVSPPESEPEQPDGAADNEARRRFVGMTVGQEFHHGASPTAGQITLAPGLERLSTVSFADGWVFIGAREGADLVVLLVHEGVVTDDVTLAGFGEHGLTPDCDTEADVFMGVTAPGGCADADSQPTVRGFAHDGPRLTDVAEPSTCWCDVDEP